MKGWNFVLIEFEEENQAQNFMLDKSVQKKTGSWSMKSLSAVSNREAVSMLLLEKLEKDVSDLKEALIDLKLMKSQDTSERRSPE